jgi:hypothetical protein
MEEAMKNLSESWNDYFRPRKLLHFSLVVLIFVAQFSEVHTSQALWRQEGDQNSTLQLNDQILSELPIAMDDSGPGFITDEKHILETAMYWRMILKAMANNYILLTMMPRISSVK